MANNATSAYTVRGVYSPELERLFHLNSGVSATSNGTSNYLTTSYTNVASIKGLK